MESRCSGLDDYEKPRTCLDLLCRGSKLSGVYQVYPDGTDVYSFDVYCDMRTDGGGWTVSSDVLEAGRGRAKPW